MEILFINNDGGGFADKIEVPQGTSDQMLQPGDRVSITLTKIEGAAQ